MGGVSESGPDLSMGVCRICDLPGSIRWVRSMRVGQTGSVKWAEGLRGWGRSIRRVGRVIRVSEAGGVIR